MFHRQLPIGSSAYVTITGKFTPDRGERAKAARVLFLIVQGNGPDAVTAQGEGEWVAGGPNEWTGRVKRQGHLPDGNSTKPLEAGFARGIALAIVVKPGKLTGSRFDPPTIQALTWCSDFEFV